MDAYLTIGEAARRLGVTPQAIRLRLGRGVMRGERIHPRLWLIPSEEVERWQALGRQKPGPKPREKGAKRS